MATSRKLIGKIIRHFRKQSGMTQGELGAIVNMDAKYISKIECGTVNTKCDTIDKLIKALPAQHTDFFNHSNIS